MSVCFSPSVGLAVCLGCACAPPVRLCVDWLAAVWCACAVCGCVCSRVGVSLCECLRKWARVSVRSCVWARMPPLACVCVCVCACVCVCVCTCVPLCPCARACRVVCMRACPCLRVRALMRLRVCARVCGVCACFVCATVYACTCLLV